MNFNIDLFDKDKKKIINKNFNDAEVFNQNISNKKFVSCSFKSINNKHSIIKDCIFSGCSFDSVEFNEVELENCIFEKCNFNQINIKTCYFKKVEFDQSKFINLNLVTNLIYNTVFNCCQISDLIIIKNIFNDILLENNKLEKIEAKKNLYQNSKIASTSFLKISLFKDKLKNVAFSKPLIEGILLEHIKYYNSSGLPENILKLIKLGNGRLESIFEKKIFKFLNKIIMFLLLLSVLFFIAILYHPSFKKYNVIFTEAILHAESNRFNISFNLIYECLRNPNNIDSISDILLMNRVDNELIEKQNEILIKLIKQKEEIDIKNSWYVSTLYNQINKYFSSKYNNQNYTIIESYDGIFKNLNEIMESININSIKSYIYYKFALQFYYKDDTYLYKKIAKKALEYRNAIDKDHYQDVVIQASHAAISNNKFNQVPIGEVLFILKQDKADGLYEDGFLYVLISEIYDNLSDKKYLNKWLELIVSSGYDNNWYLNSNEKKKIKEDLQYFINKNNFNINLKKLN